MILFDTNVLVYAINADANQHVLSRKAVEAVMSRKVAGVLFPKNIMEFYAIVTDRRRFQDTLSPNEAWRQIQNLYTIFVVLDSAIDAIQVLAELKDNITGPQIFDAYLVAQMKTKGVSAICTYNKKHFLPFEGIVALTPEELLETL